MTFSRATLVQRVRNALRDYPWETTSTTTTTSSTVAVPDGTKWQTGDIGEWSYSGTVQGEQFLVQSVSGNNLTTVRGYNGTTAETHSSGDRVIKNPLYFYRDIVEAIDETLLGLWPTVWTVVSQDVTPDLTANWIDSALSAAEAAVVMDLSSVGQVYGASSDLWGSYGTRGDRRVLFSRNMPTATWTSGIAVMFPDGFFHPTNAVTFRWRARITDTVTGSNYDDISDGKLTEGVVWLAASKLLFQREAETLALPTNEELPSVGSHSNIGAFFNERGKRLLLAYKRELEETIPRMPNQRWG